MLIKIIKPILIFLIIFILVLIPIVFSIFYKNKIHVLFSVNEVTQAEASLQWDNQLNLKQSTNACGSYSTMVYLFASSGKIYDPEKIKIEYGEQNVSNLISPARINIYLNMHGSKSNIYYLGLLSASQKIDWIKEKIVHGNPVIAAVGAAAPGHYVTILGFKNKTAFMYDSNLFEDTNSVQPGNYSADLNEVVKGIESLKIHNFLPINIAIAN